MTSLMNSAEEPHCVVAVSRGIDAISGNRITYGRVTPGREFEQQTVAFEVGWKEENQE